MKVIWSRRAVRHLAALRQYIAKDNPAAAPETAERILAAVELLRAHPNLGRSGRLLGTREIVIPDTPFVIPYRVREGSIELIAIFHGRQKWPEKL